MNANKILITALDLQKKHTKLEIVDMARAFGWRGDHARASILQLSLYVAGRLTEDNDRTPHDRPTEQDQPEQSQVKREAPEQSQGQQETPEQSQGQQETPEQSQGQQETPEQETPEQDQDQPGQDQPEQDQDQPEQDQPDNAAWRKLLKDAGIDRPHGMLRKVYTVAAIARLNVMLVGEGGTGKTYLAEQLAKLLRVPFSSVSCTEGMSESQLSGLLLPVGEGGRFDYVTSPFVKSLQQPSVFLLDEIDAADANVLLMMNSLLSNGFLTVPQKLDNPTIRRHPDSIIIAGANSPNGATELYTARGRMDATTVDRFYLIEVDYDESYEKSLFVIPGQKRRIRSSEWSPSTDVVDESTMLMLETWFTTLRKKKRDSRINRLVSSRMAQRLTRATLAGVPVTEAIRDCLLTWTADEMRRTGVGQ